MGRFPVAGIAGDHPVGVEAVEVPLGTPVAPPAHRNKLFKPGLLDCILTEIMGDQIKISIDWGELLDILDHRSDELVNYLDLRTGRIVLHHGELGDAEPDRPEPEWMQEQREVNRSIEDDEEGRFVAVEPPPSGEAFRWMEDYGGGVSDPALRGRLLNALRERHPFRRLKEVLSSTREAGDAWFAFERRCLEAYVQEWLDSLGVPYELKRTRTSG